MAELLYLSRDDVERTDVTMKEVIDAVEAVFREKGEDRVEMPSKLGVHPRPDSFIQAMPAYLPASESAGVKWVSVFPENKSRGLPYITGLIILNDAETGLPICIMDAAWITAVRTGAATAVAARYLARKDSATIGVLGAGVQGFSNLEALKTLFPLREVAVYDTAPDQIARYERKVLEKWPEMTVLRAEAPRQAVEGLDIVITAGPILKTPHATIKAGWLSPGAFASLIDYDSYWSREAIRETDKFVTDDIPQLQLYQSMGRFRSLPDVYSDLGELVTGKKPGRERDDERTMTCNLGLAIDDIATAPLVLQRAQEKGIGTQLPL